MNSEQSSVKVVIGGDVGGADLAATGVRVCVADGRDAVLKELPDADGYVPGPWDDEVLAAAPGLRWVHFMWAGVDGLIFPAAVESDVTITNSAGAFAVPMAEHVMALMLAFARGVHLCTCRSPHDLWHAEGSRGSLTPHMREMSGATLGILGYGGIGRETARRAKAFDMRVVALRRRPTDDDPFADEVFGPERLDDLLRESDYLLISCALTDETCGMIGARELALMKPGAVIVNVARGAVIDEAALVAALQDGPIRGAGLDVTDREPLPLESPLWGMENVIVTPHVAGASPRTQQRQLEVLRENLRLFAAGEPLLNVVDKRLGY